MSIEFEAPKDFADWYSRELAKCVVDYVMKALEPKRRGPLYMGVPTVGETVRKFDRDKFDAYRVKRGPFDVEFERWSR